MNHVRNTSSKHIHKKLEKNSLTSEVWMINGDENFKRDYFV